MDLIQKLFCFQPKEIIVIDSRLVDTVNNVFGIEVENINMGSSSGVKDQSEILIPDPIEEKSQIRCVDPMPALLS